MTRPRALIDSDAFLLLSGAGALDSTLDLLGVEVADAMRLDPLPHMIERSASIRQRYDSATREAAKANCRRIAPITVAPSPQVTEALSIVDEIDAGEVILYGLAIEHPSILLASNDKRAMRAISQTPSLATIRNAVAGRVVCLEAILGMHIRADGVAAAANRFAPVIHADTMLQVVLTHHNIHNPADCRDALASYTTALRQDVGADFLYAAPG